MNMGTDWPDNRPYRVSMSSSLMSSGLFVFVFSFISAFAFAVVR